ncbi:hypothetical protein CU097_004642 [Rhizopus azygosporus]|uniref:Uncharacterized protein n=1 Tax=Rhizopus azygosporus TaxID=86630 RepID=A0A367J1H3_RHIAZ|nr:hypothetical protein CU097_004642 [Rhizopus azygosporus]
MAGSFTLVKTPGKKISLEQYGHTCPKCKSIESVRLTRSERRWILFNKCISSINRVRYECSSCNWKNEQLPQSNLPYELDDPYCLTSPSTPSTPSTPLSHRLSSAY